VRRLLGPLLARTPTLATLESLAPWLRRPERLPERVPAVGPRRAVVGMLTG
jgi:glycolate dehydrogenase iron-sulfur subunit